MPRPLRSDRDELELDILDCLSMGEETTLLLWSMVAEPAEAGDDEYSETDVVRALSELERRGLVVGRTEIREPVIVNCGIPEYERGLAEATWWRVTEEGERLRAKAG